MVSVLPSQIGAFAINISVKIIVKYHDTVLLVPASGFRPPARSSGSLYAMNEVRGRLSYTDK